MHNKRKNLISIKQLINKVPGITLSFWIIKILCTTIGETAADFLNEKLNLGLTGNGGNEYIAYYCPTFFNSKPKSMCPLFIGSL